MLRSQIEAPVGSLPRPVILADRHSLRLVDNALQCDVHAFEALAKSGQTQDALALYRGELLPGYYDDWIDECRLQLNAHHDRLVDAPGPEPHSASASKLRRPPPLVPLRHVLPNYLTRLFGADGQATELHQVVQAHRLVTVLGPGGSGKTRMAVELASSFLHQRGDWPPSPPWPSPHFDLIAFVPLASCFDRDQALEAITAALQISTEAKEPMVALLRALSDRPALIVLDNFERLVEKAQDLVARLVRELPALHLLVTSRRPLALDGEVEFGFAPLVLPAVDSDLASSAINPALALFVDRARAVRADFHLSARNCVVLIELVRELEGMPLAIELAAARVRSMSPADMLARLRGAGTPSLELLSRSAVRGAPEPRHASMERVIAWSWNLLDQDAHRLLAVLTIFPGSFSALAASRLVDGDVALRLDELVGHSLVQTRSAEDDNARFSIYQPIREFAAERLAPEYAALFRARLRLWAIEWAHGLPRTPPLDALRAEMPNLVAAIDSAVDDHCPDDAVHLLDALRRCLEDVELPTQGLARAPRSSPVTTRCCERVAMPCSARRFSPQASPRRRLNMHSSDWRRRACPTPKGRGHCTRWHACAGAAAAVRQKSSPCSMKPKRWPPAHRIRSCRPACWHCARLSPMPRMVSLRPARPCTPKRWRFGSGWATSTQSTAAATTWPCARKVPTATPRLCSGCSPSSPAPAFCVIGAA